MHFLLGYSEYSRCRTCSRFLAAVTLQLLCTANTSDVLHLAVAVHSLPLHFSYVATSLWSWAEIVTPHHYAGCQKADHLFRPYHRTDSFKNLMHWLIPGVLYYTKWPRTTLRTVIFHFCSKQNYELIDLDDPKMVCLKRKIQMVNSAEVFKDFTAFFRSRKARHKFFCPKILCSSQNRLLVEELSETKIREYSWGSSQNMFHPPHEKILNPWLMETMDRTENAQTILYCIDNEPSA